MKACLVALAAGVAVFTVVAVASADSMDPALSRLTANPTRFACATDRGAANSGVRCVRDNAAFKQLINQFGFAFAPSAMHSARTTGYGGFHLSIEGQYTTIDADAEYMKRGTQGPRDPNTNASAVRNEHPSSWLQLYSAKLRKSFGFGFEIMGTLGVMPKTTLLSTGADVRLSLLEGFREGIPGFIPDLALGGGVRTITGTPEFQLTVAAADAQVSKPFAVGDSSILIPWVGYQYAWIFGDSGLIDLTPATDPIGACGYAGTNVPSNPDPNKPNVYDGQPVCLNGGSTEDFNNNIVFNPVRLERQRILLGLAYRYEMVVVSGQFLTDTVPVADAQTGNNTTDVPVDIDRTGKVLSYRKVSDSELLKDVERQYTLVFEIGMMF
jgi:hypothetical protein